MVPPNLLPNQRKRPAIKEQRKDDTPIEDGMVEDVIDLTSISTENISELLEKDNSTDDSKYVIKKHVLLQLLKEHKVVVCVGTDVL